MRWLIGVVLSLAAWPMLAADPFLGTWKLNPAESDFGNTTGLKQAVMTWTPEGNGIRVKTTAVKADGQESRESYLAVYNGERRLNRGPWNFDAVANRQVNEREREDLFYRDGKEVGRNRLVVSPDGKRLTVQHRFAEESSTRVFDRQD